MKRCLVIGGSGFIGQNVVRELISSGRKVSVLDIREPQESQGITFHNSSLLPDNDLVNVLNQHEEVIDLAYLSNPKTSYDDPLKDIIENLQSTVKTFALALNCPNIQKFLYISSGGAIYGNIDDDLITEEHSTTPISPYGITKLAIEKYGFMFAYSKQFPFIAARPSNAYGPGQAANRGQGFIAQSIYNILHGQPVVVFGNEGTVRDYIYISDLAKGIVALLDCGRIGEAYNLGTGVGSSNLQVLKILESICAKDNVKVKVEHLPERKFDVNKNVLNCSKLKEHCQWSPSVSLEEGLQNSWNFYFQNKI